MAARDSGWIQMYVENAQEAYDSIIQAFRIAEDTSVSLPILVGLDGFTLSHTLENVNVLSDETVITSYSIHYTKLYDFLFSKRNSSGAENVIMR